MGLGRIFSRGWAIVDISAGDKNGEIQFYPLETKEKTLFAKSLIEKCQISKSKGKASFRRPTLKCS